MSIAIKPFGKHGQSTSRLGYGCMSLSATFYGETGLTEDDSIAIVQHAYDKGVRLFNTSDLYGPYTNEIMLGKALKDKGDVLISTKWGPMNEQGKWSIDFSPANCRRCCEGALERLQVESIGLFTMRGPFTNTDFPITETAQELKALVGEGKIIGVGLSEVSADDIKAVHAVVPVTAVELEWSLFSRDAEVDLVPTCRELGIAVMAYSPLGRGMLTGTVKNISELPEKDFRRVAAPRFQGENFDKNLQLVANLEALAAQKGVTPGQLALAWVLAQGEDVFPIPGTKRIKYLDENIGAVSISLTEEEVKQLEEAVPIAQVAGDRYGTTALTYHAKKGESHAH